MGRSTVSEWYDPESASTLPRFHRALEGGEVVFQGLSGVALGGLECRQVAGGGGWPGISRMPSSVRLSRAETRAWSLRSVQTKLIKMGGRLVRHARRLVFQLAEVAVSREVFRQVLERIAGLHPALG